MRTSFERALDKREFKQTSRRSCLDRRADKFPGPGSYSPDDQRSRLSAPKYGFGTQDKLKMLTKFQAPAPNMYKVNDSI